MKGFLRGIAAICGIALGSTLGCGSSDEEGESEENGTGGSLSGGSGACAADQAGQSCGNSCSFEPTTIDCMAACENIAEKCSTAECETECTGLNQDVNACMAACEGTKSLNCTNEAFACWASESTCAGVGTCFQSATEQDAGDGDGDGDGSGGTEGDGDGDGSGGMASGTPGPFSASIDGVTQNFDNDINANRFDFNGWFTINGENADGDKIEIGFSSDAPGSYSCPDDNTNMVIRYYRGVQVQNTQTGQASCSLEVTEVGAVGERIKGTFEVAFDLATITGGTFDVERGEDM